MQTLQAVLLWCLGLVPNRTPEPLVRPLALLYLHVVKHNLNKG